MRAVSVALLLLLLSAVGHGQSTECEESELGYACRKEMTDYFALHWSLGPTTSGAEAGEGEIAIALVGQTEGWVGFAFAEVEGAMSPSDFVIGWVTGRRVVANPYRSEIQSIAEDNEDESIELTGIEGNEDGGFTTVQFVRSLTDGTVPIVLDEAIPVNVATGSEDGLVYHGPVTRFAGTVTLNLALENEPSAAGGGAPAPAEEATTAAPEGAVGGEAPTPEPQSEAPTPEPQPEAPAPAPAETEGATAAGASAEGAGCTPSTLDYSCMSEEGDITLHWTIGPASAQGDVPDIAEGEVAMAASASTDGWVGVSFAETAGSMDPADGIIGWVDASGPFVRAYRIVTTSVGENDETQDIGIRATGGSEQGGVTTIQFVMTGTFTFPVDLTSTIDMNWATGNADSLVYHQSSRGSFAINLQSGASEATSPTLKYYKAHGSCMIIAWIGLAPLGVIVARNKYAFLGISKGAWFQIHRALQIFALLFMVCGLIIALAEFDDPASDEGKRHRRIGIAIITVSLVQGFMGMVRPSHESPVRFLFNYAHWWLGRASVVMGIATVFLGIKAFDLLNDDDVDKWWITCLVILCVYFALATVGEIFVARHREEEGHEAKHEADPSMPTELARMP